MFNLAAAGDVCPMNLAFPNRICPVWLASYPRSGNTFLRIILQNLFGLATYSMYRTEGDDFPDPSADVLEKAPYLPRDWRRRVTDGPGAELMVIKTHGGLEPSGRAIYIVREGYAVVESYFNYHKRFSFEQPSLTEIIAGACQFGGWSEHYVAWQPQSRPKTLLLRYELLVNQPHECVPLLADFLGMPPQTGRLPTFAELKERSPAFFRHGQDRSFLRDWTPAQLALFSELHGAVMQELGYATEWVSESCPASVIEMAHSAARSHRLYLEQLSCAGAHAAILSEVRGQLTKSAAACERLTDAEARLSAQVAESEEALRCLHKNLWVKLGATVGLVRPKRKGEQGATRESRPVQANASAASAAMPNLR
jgi:hypothetical protein